MALKQYLAVAAGQYDNRVIAAGEVFAAEFRGLKRDAAGAVVRDADGESVLVAIPDPAWVRRVGGAGPDADGAVDRGERHDCDRARRVFQQPEIGREKRCHA